jgi:Ca2+-binding EF-hand superfamily protein
MALPLLLLAMLGAAPTDPIFVKGHAWAPFISPMGEPFRARTVDDDTLTKWFAQADRNHDGSLTSDEMIADADRFFATLDTNHDGEIDPDELVKYEWEVAPDIQLMSRTQPAPGAPRDKPEASRDHHEPPLGGLQGAARYGLLNIPEPVAAADTDFDRGISLAEFRSAAVARFQLLDVERTGRLALGQLQALRTDMLAANKTRHKADAVDARLGNPLPPGN